MLFQWLKGKIKHILRIFFFLNIRNQILIIIQFEIIKDRQTKLEHLKK